MREGRAGRVGVKEGSCRCVGVWVIAVFPPTSVVGLLEKILTSI